MARALPRCIWFTETEFVFNKKQTFQKMISSETSCQFCWWVNIYSFN